MKFSALVENVSFVVADAANLVFSVARINAFLAEAETLIIGLVPGTNPVSESINSTAGTQQQLPANGVRLLSVETIGGRGVRLVERGVKDDLEPLWRSANPASSASEYMFDDRIPRKFETPPLQAGVAISLTYDQTPDEYDFLSDPDFTISASYSAAMVDYAVYRCLSRADENTPEFGKANAHYQSFLQKATGKAKVDIQQSPKQRRFLQ